MFLCFGSLNKKHSLSHRGSHFVVLPARHLVYFIFFLISYYIYMVESNSACLETYKTIFIPVCIFSGCKDTEARLCHGEYIFF